MSSVLRCLNLAKQFKSVIQSPSTRTTTVSIRSFNDQGWAYRKGKTEKQSEQWAQAVCTVGWWWFLWHIWHDYEMFTGEFPNLFPDQWTDEELGIPRE